MRLVAVGAVAGGLALTLACTPPAVSAERVVIRTLTPTERRAMTPSVWRPGCPVSLGSLRRLSVPYVDFAGRPRRGVLVVHHSVAADVSRVMTRLRAARFPIRRMVPIERYRGSDDRSVAADNTSAFNCRRTTGSRTWSRHAYGRAIDVNPIENPYVVGGRTKWRRSRAYLDRTRVRKGMAVEGGVLVRAFDAVGWEWGGRWRSPVDYQHFAK
jgi:hypothetical protein